MTRYRDTLLVLILVLGCGLIAPVLVVAYSSGLF